MPEIWFTADLHFGHELVAGHRGFRTAEELPDVAAHDLAIIDMWEDLVSPRDQVWVLGDLDVGQPKKSLPRLKVLPGTKHLIPGNHDRCHPARRRSHAYQRGYLEVFDSVQLAARRKMAGRNVLMSHFPYTADREEMRYPQWRLPDCGDFLLHGHTHSSDWWTGPREINVGLDAWGLTLVSFAQLEAMIYDGPLIDEERPD